MKNFLNVMLSVAGGVFMLAGFAGIINMIFGTKLGVGTLTGGASTGEIPPDPVIIGVLVLLGAICLGIEFLRSRRRVAQTQSSQV